MTSPLLQRVSRLLSWDGNPILVRELRSLLRGRLFTWFLTIATLLLGLLVFTVGAIAIAEHTTPSTVGEILFHLFFIVAFLVFGIVGPIQTASALTSEKEQRTLEGIILTGLRPWRIVWGKFVGSLAAMFMVLVAFLPVAGISLLFGGVSPLHIVLGYAALFLLVLPASAYGLAVSAHLSSSRVATVIVALSSVAATVGLLIFLTFLGSRSMVRTGGGFDGPFFFVDLVAGGPASLELVGAIATVTFTWGVLPTWFFLAAALSAVRPPSHDRVAPLKVWALATIAWALATAALDLATNVHMPLSQLEDAGVRAVSIAGLVEAFFALLFVNEPTISPVRIRPRGWLGQLAGALAPIGPGAAPTLRFSMLAITGTALAIGGVVYTTYTALVLPASRSSTFLPALFVVAAGTAAAALALAGFGALLRVLTGRGVVARLLAVAALASVILVPLFVLAISEPMRSTSRDLSLVVFLSPIFPLMLADGQNLAPTSAWRANDVLPQVALNLSLALVFWLAVEYRTMVATRERRAAEAARVERARASVPSLPLLQVERSSLVPGTSGPAQGAGEAPGESGSGKGPGRP